MKMTTTQKVSLTPEEVTKILIKFIEKKTNKKVVSATDKNEFILQDEVSDLDKETV